MLALAAAVFAVAFGVRLAFTLAVGPETSGDSAEYLQVARNLVGHGVYSHDAAPPLTPSIRRAPGYPAFLAAVMAVAGDRLTAVAVAQAALDAAVAAMVLLLAATAVPLPWAAGAALFYALHPGPIPYANLVLSETLFAAALFGGVFAAAAGLAGDRLWPTAAGGLLFGAAALVRPVALLLPPVAAAVCWLWRAAPRRRAHAAALLACAALAVAPWCVRSSLLAGRLVPVQGAGLANVYEPTKKNSQERDAYAAARERIASPAELADTDRMALRLAVANVLADPAGYLRSRARRYPRLFFSTFAQFTRAETPFSTLVAERDLAGLAARGGLLLVFSVVPLALGLVGLRGARRSPALALSAAVWLYTAAVHVPLWTEYRFWVPAVPPLVVSAAAGAHMLWQRRNGTAR